MRNGRKSTFMVAALTAVALVGGSAFTAANTMPTETHAGSGTVSVTGYTAETIDYTLTGDTVESVAIDVTGTITDGSSAELQLVDAGTWYTCTIGTHNSTDDFTPLTCTIGDVMVENANNVSLVIAD